MLGDSSLQAGSELSLSRDLSFRPSHSINTDEAKNNCALRHPSKDPCNPISIAFTPETQQQSIVGHAGNPPSQNANALKHDLSAEDLYLQASTFESPNKRSRTGRPLALTISRHSYDGASPLATPVSPRNAARPRTLRRQTAVTLGTSPKPIMNKSREELSGITTLKLARGSVSNASPPRANNVGSVPGWTALETRNTAQKTPDPRSPKSTGSQLIGSIGVVEFLELDERPTFIIDLANTANYTPGGALQPLFANAALRAHENIIESVTGKADLTSPGIAVTNDFPEFKAWVLSFVRNYESLDVSLPQFQYGGITWTCSTLRKRLRLVSGTANNATANTASTSSVGTGSGPSASIERIKAPQGILPSSPLVTQYEPMDYFGDIDQESTTTESTPSHTIVPDLNGHEHMQMGVPLQAMRMSPENALSTKNLRTRYSEAASFDWTRLPMSAALPRHIQFCKSIDWASTSLGPMEDWAFDLRAMCNLIMGSPHPAAMYWGDDRVAIYNEAYILLAGHKHPKLMGMRYEDAWKEIWADIEDVFLNAQYAGQATMKDDDCLFVNRNGFLEEAYFSWSIIPLIGDDGSVVGMYNPAFDKTRRKIAERRMLTLREIGERTATARQVKEFWGQVIQGLEYNEHDVPFCLLYSVADDTDNDIGSMHSGSLSQAPQLTLEGTLGVPADHEAAVSPLDLRTSEEAFAPYLREAMKQNRPVLLSIDEGTLAEDLIAGFQWRGFGDPCRYAVICPIHPTTGETILGFLVMGINPRRPYDDDYSLFIQLLSRQLATSMASVVLFEEEIRRGQRAAKLAALDRQELSKQLDLRTQEAEESETKFTRMAELAPIGLFIADSEGAMTYSNDTWWEITRHPRTRDSTSTWMESIKDEDREGVQKIWKALVHERTAITTEFRFKTPWQDNNGNRGSTWVLMSAYPEVADGKLKSVFGSITNISQTKWVEGFQKRRMEEAIELKRQQENFIDMTSHEMRNPLSAILQCSDEITSSLTAYRAGEEISTITEKLNDILESSIDASQTIALCAQHQKRIVDDILTLSKLDSALLVVTPVAVQPIAVVQRALKMFEGELDSNDIAMEFRMERSYLELGVDWVKLDPSRLLQVLINLTTNAIKFTHGQDKRTIVVSVGASRQKPESYHSDVTYFQSRSNQDDTTIGPDWGAGEELFLHFAVQDTGRGLDENEKALLFQRFSQASPRTHVQYGGSGLGLFISRQLSELQGGQIGVSSERGVGSTFAFYVRGRRVEGISEDTPIAKAVNAFRNDSTLTSIVIESRRNSAGKPLVRSHNSGRSTRRSSAIGPVPSPQPTPPLPKPKIDHSKLRVLIVEDNLVNQRVLQKQLKNLGFPTVVANHGGEALEILKATKFWRGKETEGDDLTVILMDLEMPIMDGLSCSREIRRLQSEGTIVRHVPVIAVTANARMEQIETAMAAGMDDVVSKPFRIPELIPKIEELVTKSPPPTVPPLPVIPTLSDLGLGDEKEDQEKANKHLRPLPALAMKAVSSPSVMRTVVEEDKSPSPGQSPKSSRFGKDVQQDVEMS